MRASRKIIGGAALLCAAVFAVILVWMMRPKEPRVAELTLTLHEVLVDEVNSEKWVRFRFHAPQISKKQGGITYEQVARHIEDLCRETALPYMDKHKLTGDFVVISLADQKTKFGEAHPDVTQYFEAFKITDNMCVWEAY